MRLRVNLKVEYAEFEAQACPRRGNGFASSEWWEWNVQLSNIQYPLFNDGGANWILAVGCWIFAHSTYAFFPFARCGGQGKTKIMALLLTVKG